MKLEKWTDLDSLGPTILIAGRRLENTNSRLTMNEGSIQKLSETIESQQEELHRGQAEERRRRDHRLLHE